MPPIARSVTVRFRKRAAKRFPGFNFALRVSLVMKNTKRLMVVSIAVAARTVSCASSRNTASVNVKLACFSRLKGTLQRTRIVMKSEPVVRQRGYSTNEVARISIRPMPIMSVKVVKKMLLAVAGSAPNRLSTNGTATPKMPVSYTPLTLPTTPYV